MIKKTKKIKTTFSKTKNPELIQRQRAAIIDYYSKKRQKKETHKKFK